MPRGKTFGSVTQTIGDTPMIRINRLVPEGHATVFAKCEFFQPLNSVKDRIGVAMIDAAAGSLSGASGSRCSSRSGSPPRARRPRI